MMEELAEKCSANVWNRIRNLAVNETYAKEAEGPMFFFFFTHLDILDLTYRHEFIEAEMLRNLVLVPAPRKLGDSDDEERKKEDEDWKTCRTRTSRQMRST